MRALLIRLSRCRTRMKPETRNGLDGFAVLFAITLFFCLVQSAHDGLAKRNRSFDPQRWWYPIYKLFQSNAAGNN